METQADEDASFPEGWNESTDCNICGSSYSEAFLTRHQQRVHENAYYANRLGYRDYRKPAPDLRRCEDCHIFIGDDFIEEHDTSNKLHLHNVMKNRYRTHSSSNESRRSMNISSSSSSSSSWESGCFNVSSEESNGASLSSSSTSNSWGSPIGIRVPRMRGLSFVQRLPADAPLRQIETPALEQSTRSSSNASEHCHSSRDWMPRDDDIDFSQPWNGEVVLSPVKFRLGPGEKNDAAKLFERAHNHKYFARVRIVRTWREEPNADVMVDVYRIDLDNRLVRAAAGSLPTKRGLEQTAVTVTASLSLRDLLGTGYLLPHMVVLRNLKKKEKCQECGSLTSLRKCDGRYPALYGTDFPEGADALHFECFRGLLCEVCEEKLPEKKKYWFCAKCVDPPENVVDVIGCGIQPPTYLLAEGVLAVNSWPRGGYFGDKTEHPADSWLRRIQENKARREVALRRLGDEEIAQRKAAAAEKFLRTCRGASLSRGEQNTFLRLVHGLHDVDALLLDGSSDHGALALPKDIRTVEERALGSVFVDDDVEVHTRYLDQSRLEQEVKLLRVYIADPLQALQALLLDVPAGSVYLQRRGSLTPNLVDGTGNALHGYELVSGSRWGSLMETIQHGTFLLGFGIHGDGAEVGSDWYHPYSITCANVPHKFAKKRNGAVKFALNAKPVIRTPRGMVRSERLPENVKVVKYNLESRSAAEIMGYVNARAGEVLHFLVRAENGDLLRLPFMVRWVHHEADIEEQIKVHGLKGKICLQCGGVESAMCGENRGRGTANRPFMKLDEAHCCLTAPRRTPLKVLREQVRLAMLSRTGMTKKEVNKACKDSRVRPFVFNSCIALTNILPHSCGGPYALGGLDLLHGVQKGPAGTMVSAAVILMRKDMTQTASFKSHEDMHGRQDYLLGQFKGQKGQINFPNGVWGGGKVGGFKGDEQLALCRLLIFTMVGSSQMMKTPELRKTFLRYYWLFLRLVNEFKTQQFYTEEELVELEKDVKECVVGFHWIMDQVESGLGEAEKNELKDAFDVLKVHLFAAASRVIRENGSLPNINTEAGERSLLDFKTNNRLVDSSEDAILKRSYAVRIDAVLNDFERYTHETAPQSPTFARSRNSPPEFHNTASRLAVGAPWTDLCDLLQSGRNGPAVSDALLQEMEDMVEREGSYFEGGVFHKQCAIHASTKSDVEYEVLRPGQTIRLKGERRFAQVLLPRVFHERSASKVGRTALVSLFKTAAKAVQKTGFHPELPVPFLVRTQLLMVLLDDIVETVHVIPYHGDQYLTPGLEHFLHNTTAEAVYRGGEDREAFWQCPKRDCIGRKPYPRDGPFVFLCPLCGYVFPDLPAGADDR